METNVMKLLLLLLTLSIITPVLAEGEAEVNVDPWQGLNEKTHQFNDMADKILLKPLARGYVKVIPRLMRLGISHFFANLNEINNGINNILQGKPRQAIGDFSRLVINTTVGLGGILDPASKLGLAKHNESFGQTLQVWGVPKGPYVVLPFLGPRTLTDALVGSVNLSLDPIRYYRPVADRNMVFALRGLDERASLLPIESAVFGDRYIFLRDAYLQRQAYLVNDGAVEDAFDDF